MRILALCTVAFLVPSWPAAAELVDGIVLRVDNRMATLSEYQIRRSERIQQILASEEPADEKSRLLEAAGRDVLLEIYQELLLLARADQLAMRVSSDELEHAVQQSRERMGLETQAQLESALAESGRSMDDLRERTRINLLVQQVVGREVQSAAAPTEEEIRRYYREHPEQFEIPPAVRLREVIVRAEAFDDGASLDAAANRLRRRLDAGESLADIAASGSASGETTGLIDLDWVSLPDLDPALAAGLEDVPAGTVAGPIAARGGLHLVEIAERREAGKRMLSDVTAGIRGYLAQGRFEEELDKLLDQVESQAWIVVNEPPEAAGFRGANATPPPMPEPAPAAADAPSAAALDAEASASPED